MTLAWTASTSANTSGYTIYRQLGTGAWTALNAVPTATLAYNDTTATVGQTYNYRATAVWTGSPTLESVVSNVVSLSVAPDKPASLGIVGATTITSSNYTALPVDVTMPASSLASETITLVLSDGTHTITRTANATAGAGVVHFTGIDTSSLTNGPVTISASSSLNSISSTATTLSTTKSLGSLNVGAGFDTVACTSGGCTSGEMDSGDQIVFTFGVAPNPASIKTGWTGASTPVTLTLTDSGPSDSLTLPGLGTVALNGDYVGPPATRTFSANMVLSGNVVTVTFTQNPANRKRETSKTTLVWTPLTSITDMSGNHMSASPVNESGSFDVNF
jgi:hypothetical protein